MNVKSTISTARETEFARDDAPRLTREIAKHARLAVGDHVIREARPRGRPPKAASMRKVAVSLRLSPSVLTHFREGGEGWQTRIDEVLRSFVRDQAAGIRAEQRGRSLGPVVNSGRTASVREATGRFDSGVARAERKRTK